MQRADPSPGPVLASHAGAKELCPHDPSSPPQSEHSSYRRSGRWHLHRGRHRFARRARMGTHRQVAWSLHLRWLRTCKSGHLVWRGRVEPGAADLASFGRPRRTALGQLGAMAARQLAPCSRYRLLGCRRGRAALPSTFSPGAGLHARCRCAGRRRRQGASLQPVLSIPP